MHELLNTELPPRGPSLSSELPRFFVDTSSQFGDYSDREALVHAAGTRELDWYDHWVARLARDRHAEQPWYLKQAIYDAQTSLHSNH